MATPQKHRRRVSWFITRRAVGCYPPLTSTPTISQSSRMTPLHRNAADLEKIFRESS